MKFKQSFLLPTLLLLASLVFVSSCKKDDDEGTTGEAPVASFQFEISATNYLEVTFSNFSNNADSYTWNFGDGNTSTEENPVHSYTAGGTYTVELTAIGAEGSDSFTRDVVIVDPNTESVKLTGTTSKVWKLLRTIVPDEEYPLQVGPEDQSQIWWAYGLNDPIGSRPCLMEEEYIFAVGNVYTYDAKGEVFADYGIWNPDVAGQCVDENDATAMSGPNGEDLSAWGSGDFTFDFNPSAGTLTLNGLGAHIGLPKVASTSEVNVPQNSVTYSVRSLDVTGPVDKLVLETSIPGGYWRFILVSYDNPADEPDLPGAPPTSAFTYSIDGSTVTFDNNSVNATSYAWDFGDGNTSTQENPIHTYANDGSYNVVLTATNTVGSTDLTANIIISSTTFSLATLNGGGNKSWKLNPDAAALKVGPSIGSGEWWANSFDDVAARACTFDDTYSFNTTGDFVYATYGDLWAEPYMGVDPAGCIAESALIPDAAAWGSGSHTFTFTEAVGGNPAYLTITGTGAFIGLAKAYNGGEYASGPPATNGSITYQVLSYLNDGTNEILVLTLDISAGQTGGAYWTFTLRAD